MRRMSDEISRVIPGRPGRFGVNVHFRAISCLSLATTASDSVRDDSLLERSEVVFSEPKVVGLLEPGACHLPRGKRWGSGRSGGGLTVPGVASW
jgi:hypothetical protein